MGSASNRNKGDQPRIKLPKAILTGTGIGYNMGDISADQCPISFQCKVAETHLAVHGLHVTLEQSGDRYRIMISGTEIGILNTSQSKVINNCSGIDIYYSGKIVIQKNNTYARFQRVN